MTTNIDVLIAAWLAVHPTWRIWLTGHGSQPGPQLLAHHIPTGRLLGIHTRPITARSAPVPPGTTVVAWTTAMAPKAHAWLANPTATDPPGVVRQTNPREPQP